MKWYKKQMDKILGEQTAKLSLGKDVVARKKTGAQKISFPNPVAISKKNRPKTDCV